MKNLLTNAIVSCRHYRVDPVRDDGLIEGRYHIPQMEALRPPVRCPHCNGQPNWQEVRQPYLDEDPPGRLGVHPLIGWRCNIYPYFLAVSQWES